MKKLHSLLFAFLLSGLLSVTAQITDYRNFNGSPDGAYPEGDLTISGNLMFGATSAQGTNSGTFGTIFSIHSDGTHYKVLHSFLGGTTDGNTPSFGALALSNGVLYGTALYDGANGVGIVFSVDTLGNNFQILHSFGSTSTDGQYPEGQPTVVGNVLFGLTSSGGLNGYGGIYSVNTNGGNYQLRASYDTAGNNGNNPLGELTFAGSGTIFYGLTSQGGTLGYGNIFSFDSVTNTITSLHDFNGTDGNYPAANLTFYSGLYYGMSEVGGANGFGNIFSFNPSGNVVTNLHSFNGTDGAYPGGEFISLRRPALQHDTKRRNIQWR